MAKQAATMALTEETDMGRPPAAQQPTRLLSKLKFTDMKRSAAVNIADPVMRARAKLIEGIQEQVKHIQAEIKGEEYNPTALRYVTADDGSRQRLEMPKRKMLWYWKQGSTYYTEVRYGSSPVDFGQGSAIEAGDDLASVIEILDVVIEATEKGELDEELGRLAERRGRGRRAPEPEPTSPKERIQQRTTRR